MSKPSVLVLGAGGSAAWNFTKAIQSDFSVIGADVDSTMLPLAASTTNYVIPPMNDPNRIGFINDLVAEHGIDLVHAQPDIEVMWLAANADAINTRTFVPSLDTLEVCADKLATAQVLGRDLCPKSYNVSLGALDRGLQNDGWMRLRSGAGSMGALPVRSNAMMEAWLEHWHQSRGITAGEWMIAERLPGRDLSWTGVYADGELQASAAKERTTLMGANRSPANVASTASVQRIVNRDDVNTRCEEAVQRLDPEAQGVWMVDLREDATGTPMITEVNCGRFGTTSLFWAEAEGNLPLVYCWAALGMRADTAHRDACTEGAEWLRMTDMGCMLNA